LNVTVGLAPAERVSAPVGIVIDVLRATSTICQALASGWERVVCVGTIDDARALEGPGVALAGERENAKIPGFDFGNSPRELVPRVEGGTLVLTTTNGTLALLAAATRCETVLVASLLNLAAVTEAARGDEDVAILCAGTAGAFAIDDAYVAGRIVAALGGTPDDPATAAARLAGTFANADEGIGGGISAANIRRVGLDEDIPFCARESVMELVPRVVERSATSVVVAV
jgi:2-phosphosulfolactate phosphatase